MNETQNGDYGSERVLLLVDDDPLVRESLGEVLADGPHAVITAGSGAEALDQLALHPAIALLITDIMMPEMDGLALAQAARTARPDLRVLFLSGLRRPPLTEEFLPKPVSAFDLLARVGRMIDGCPLMA
jgi:CheY-like chemotaxis protein